MNKDLLRRVRDFSILLDFLYIQKPVAYAKIVAERIDYFINEENRDDENE